MVPGNEAQFASAVAAFGQLLRGDPFVKQFTYNDVIKLALPARGKDRFGYRAEFGNVRTDGFPGSANPENHYGPPLRRCR